jgi:hypothetical protein
MTTSLSPTAALDQPLARVVGFGLRPHSLDLLVLETGENRPLRASSDGVQWSF